MFNLVLETKPAIEELQAHIEDLWETKPSSLSPFDYSLLSYVLDLLDKGDLRVVTRQAKGWHIHLWLKKAILLCLRYGVAQVMESPTFGYDKIPSKFMGWKAQDFSSHQIRLVPGGTARRGAYIGKKTILMQSFVNIGAQVEDETLIDTWALVGSCAHIGPRCHLSAGVIIGGVLEPLQALPVIVEEDCFIGAQSAITEGVLVEKGSVIGMGVHLSGSTPIMDRAKGTLSYGRIPSGSVVVAGMLPHADIFLPAAIIVKSVDEKTRQKTSLNELLRLS